MNAIYDVGEYVYIRARILALNEQTDDVRYTIETASGSSRLYVSQNNEQMQRAVDAHDNTEGENIFLNCMRQLFALSAEELENCFGNGYSTVEKIVNGLSATAIIDMYNTWAIQNNIGVNSVVEYKADSKAKALKCVVLDVQTSTDKNNNPIKVYYIYHHDEEKDKHEFFTATKDQLTNLQNTVDTDYYLDQLGDAISQVGNTGD